MARLRGVEVPVKGTESLCEREGRPGPAHRLPSWRHSPCCSPRPYRRLTRPQSGTAVDHSALPPGPGRREVPRGGPAGGGQRGLGGLLPERPRPAHGRAPSVRAPALPPCAALGSGGPWEELRAQCEAGDTEACQGDIPGPGSGAGRTQTVRVRGAGVGPPSPPLPQRACTDASLLGPSPQRLPPPHTSHAPSLPSSLAGMGLGSLRLHPGDQPGLCTHPAPTMALFPARSLQRRTCAVQPEARRGPPTPLPASQVSTKIPPPGSPP